MSFELGEAFVRVRGNTSGVENDVRRAFSGGAILSSVRGLGDVITKTVGGAILGGTAILGGMALKGGLTRLLDTEDARVQLQRMGLSLAEVEQLMSGVDRTFDGTIFANPDGFRLGSALYAAGLNLEQINQAIGNTANLAAHANVPLDRVGEVLNKIAARGRITGRELEQLGIMGVPIRAILAEALNVTTGELEAMVSAGQVTSEMFQDAISGSQMLEGAAQAAGNTTRGAFRNALTAVSRLGEAFLSPLFGEGGVMVRGFQALRNALRAAVPMATSLGEAFGQAVVPKLEAAMAAIVPFTQGLFGLKTMVDPITGEFLYAGNSAFLFGEKIRGAFRWVRDAITTVRDFVSGIPGLSGALGAAGPIVLALATAASLVAKAFAIVKLATPIGAIVALVGALVYAWQNSEVFRDYVTRAMEAVQRAVQTLVGFFSGGGSLSDVMERVGEVARRVGGWLQDQLGNALAFVRQMIEDAQPRFDSIRESFDRIVEAVSPMVTWIAERLPGAFQTLWAIAQPIISFLVSLIGDTLRMAFDGVVQVVQGAFAIVAGLLDVFVGLFTGDWSRLWEGVKSVFSGVWNAIVGLVKVFLSVSVLKAFRVGFQLIRGLLTRAWAAIRNLFASSGRSLVATVRGFIDTVILRFWQFRDAVVNVIRGAWQFVANLFRSYFAAYRSTVSGAFSFIRSVISSVLSTVRGIVSGAFRFIRTTMSNAATGARTAVSNAFTAMRTAVVSRITSLITTIRGIPGRILAALRNIGNLLRGSGRALIQGLIGGITAMVGKVKDAVSGVLSAARNLLPFSPAKEGPFSGKGWTGYSGRSIAEDLAGGIARSRGAVVGEARALAQEAARALQVNGDVGVGLSPSVAASGAPGGSGSGSYTVEQLTIQVNGTWNLNDELERRRLATELHRELVSIERENS